MDIDDVKDIGSNLPDKKITPPSTDMVPGDGTGASKKLDDLTPKNQGRSTGHEGTDVSDLQGNDVLDPEGEDVLDPENDGNNLNKDKKDPKEENADSSGETEDILDPEAEKEKGDKQDKKDDKKDDSNDSEDGKGDSSGDGGTDSSNVDGGSGDSSSSGSGTDSGFGSNGNGGSDLGSGSSSSGSSGLSGTDTGLGSGGSTPELGTGGGSNLGGQVGNNALANGTGNAANLANGASNTANIANGANMANGAMQGGSAAAMQGGGAAAMQGGGSAAAGSSSAGIFANPYVLLAIVIIIVIIGLIGFILNMPGLLVGKIKQFAQDLWDGLQSMFENEAQAFINDDDVTKLAQYLTDMDYDLISYGFVRANIEDDYETFLDLEEQGYYLRESGRYSKIDSNGNETFYNGYYYSASGDLVNNETAELVVKDERFTKDKYGIRYWAADGNHRSNSGY